MELFLAVGDWTSKIKKIQGFLCPLTSTITKPHTFCFMTWIISRCFAFSTLAAIWVKLPHAGTAETGAGRKGGGNEGSNTHKAEANENNDFPTSFPSRAVASDRFQVKEKLWKDWLRCQSGVVYASFNPYVVSWLFKRPRRSRFEFTIILQCCDASFASGWLGFP